jgi:hypothetical protein
MRSVLATIGMNSNMLTLKVSLLLLINSALAMEGKELENSLEIQALDADFSEEIAFNVKDKKFLVDKKIAKKSCYLENLIVNDSEEKSFDIAGLEPWQFKSVMICNSLYRHWII